MANNKGNRNQEMVISAAEIELDGTTQLVVNLDRRPLRINGEEIQGSNFFLTERSNLPGKDIKHGVIVVKEKVVIKKEVKEQFEDLKSKGAIFISTDDRTRLVLKDICNPYRPFFAAGQMFLAELG